MKYDLAQFKFSSGQEIVCEVVAWPDEKHNSPMVVRNAMSIVMVEITSGDRVYMFKPWAHYVSHEKELIEVNADHIISKNIPNQNLVKEYDMAVKEMHEHAIERDRDYAELENESTSKFKPRIVPFPTNKKDDPVH